MLTDAAIQSATRSGQEPCATGDDYLRRMQSDDFIGIVGAFFALVPADQRAEFVRQCEELVAGGYDTWPWRAGREPR